MRSLEEDLAAAQAFHGHLCHGMVMGVRMARYGCKELGIDDPPSYRDLVVYVEMDRCASDAVSVVAGVTLGRRRLKWVDYGKMAATLVDLATDRAVRVAPRPEVPHAGPDADPLELWKDWTDEQLFTCTPVRIAVPEEDRPGRPFRRVVCAHCGEQVQDAREVVKDGEVLCRACAQGAYYQVRHGGTATDGGDVRPEGLIYVVTGERGSGKSTVCARVVREARKTGLAVAGILTERVGIDEGAARRVVDLRSGERRPFGLQHPGDRHALAGDPSTSDPLTPGWEYDPGMFAWANEALSHSTPCDLLVVDEVGPLELRGERGWAKALEVLRSREYRAALVVCRPGLLRELEERLGRAPDAVFEVALNVRDSLPRAILQRLHFLAPGQRGPSSEDSCL